MSEFPNHSHPEDASVVRSRKISKSATVNPSPFLMPASERLLSNIDGSYGGDTRGYSIPDFFKRFQHLGETEHARAGHENNSETPSASALAALEKRCLLMVNLAEQEASRRQSQLTARIRELETAVSEKDEIIGSLIGDEELDRDLELKGNIKTDKNEESAHSETIRDPSTRENNHRYSQHSVSGLAGSSILSVVRRCEDSLVEYKKRLGAAKNTFMTIQEGLTAYLASLPQRQSEIEGQILLGISQHMVYFGQYKRYVSEKRQSLAFSRLLVELGHARLSELQNYRERKFLERAIRKKEREHLLTDNPLTASQNGDSIVKNVVDDSTSSSEEEGKEEDKKAGEGNLRGSYAQKGDAHPRSRLGRITTAEQIKNLTWLLQQYESRGEKQGFSATARRSTAGRLEFFADTEDSFSGTEEAAGGVVGFFTFIKLMNSSNGTVAANTSRVASRQSLWDGHQAEGEKDHDDDEDDTKQEVDYYGRETDGSKDGDEPIEDFYILSPLSRQRIPISSSSSAPTNAKNSKRATPRRTHAASMASGSVLGNPLSTASPTADLDTKLVALLSNGRGSLSVGAWLFSNEHQIVGELHAENSAEKNEKIIIPNRRMRAFLSSSVSTGGGADEANSYSTSHEAHMLPPRFIRGMDGKRESAAAKTNSEDFSGAALDRLPSGPIFMYLVGAADLLQRYAEEVKDSLISERKKLRQLQQKALLRPERIWLKERARDLCHREIPRLEISAQAIGNSFLARIANSVEERCREQLDQFAETNKGLHRSVVAASESSQISQYAALLDMVSDGLFMSPSQYVSRVRALTEIPARGWWALSWRQLLMSAMIELFDPSAVYLKGVHHDNLKYQRLMALVDETKRSFQRELDEFAAWIRSSGEVNTGTFSSPLLSDPRPSTYSGRGPASHSSFVSSTQVSLTPRHLILTAGLDVDDVIKKAALVNNKQHNDKTRRSSLPRPLITASNIDVPISTASRTQKIRRFILSLKRGDVAKKLNKAVVFIWRAFYDAADNRPFISSQTSGEDKGSVGDRTDNNTNKAPKQSEQKTKRQHFPIPFGAAERSDLPSLGGPALTLQQNSPLWTILEAAGTIREKKRAARVSLSYSETSPAFDGAASRSSSSTCSSTSGSEELRKNHTNTNSKNDAGARNTTSAGVAAAVFNDVSDGGGEVDEWDLLSDFSEWVRLDEDGSKWDYRLKNSQEEESSSSGEYEHDELEKYIFGNEQGVTRQLSLANKSCARANDIKDPHSATQQNRRRWEHALATFVTSEENESLAVLITHMADKERKMAKQQQRKERNHRNSRGAKKFGSDNNNNNNNNNNLLANDDNEEELASPRFHPILTPSTISSKELIDRLVELFASVGDPLAASCCEELVDDKESKGEGSAFTWNKSQHVRYDGSEMLRVSLAQMRKRWDLLTEQQRRLFEGCPAPTGIPQSSVCPSPSPVSVEHRKEEEDTELAGDQPATHGSLNNTVVGDPPATRSWTIRTVSKAFPLLTTRGRDIDDKVVYRHENRADAVLSASLKEPSRLLGAVDAVLASSASTKAKGMEESSHEGVNSEDVHGATALLSLLSYASPVRTRRQGEQGDETLKDDTEKSPVRICAGTGWKRALGSPTEARGTECGAASDQVPFLNICGSLPVRWHDVVELSNVVTVATNLTYASTTNYEGNTESFPSRNDVSPTGRGDTLITPIMVESILLSSDAALLEYEERRRDGVVVNSSPSVFSPLPNTGGGHPQHSIGAMQVAGGGFAGAWHTLHHTAVPPAVAARSGAPYTEEQRRVVPLIRTPLFPSNTPYANSIFLQEERVLGPYSHIVNSKGAVRRPASSEMMGTDKVGLMPSISSSFMADKAFSAPSSFPAGGNGIALKSLNTTPSTVVYVNTILSPPPHLLKLSSVVEQAATIPDRLVSGLLMKALADYNSLAAQFSSLLCALEWRMRERYFFTYDDLDMSDDEADAHQMEADADATMGRHWNTKNDEETRTLRKSSVKSRGENHMYVSDAHVPPARNNPRLTTAAQRYLQKIDLGTTSDGFSYEDDGSRDTFSVRRSFQRDERKQKEGRRREPTSASSYSTSSRHTNSEFSDRDSDFKMSKSKRRVMKHHKSSKRGRRSRSRSDTSNSNRGEVRLRRSSYVVSISSNDDTFYNDHSSSSPTDSSSAGATSGSTRSKSDRRGSSGKSLGKKRSDMIRYRQSSSDSPDSSSTSSSEMELSRRNGRRSSTKDHNQKNSRNKHFRSLLASEDLPTRDGGLYSRRSSKASATPPAIVYEDNTSITGSGPPLIALDSTVEGDNVTEFIGKGSFGGAPPTSTSGPALIEENTVVNDQSRIPPRSLSAASAESSLLLRSVNPIQVKSPAPEFEDVPQPQQADGTVEQRTSSTRNDKLRDERKDMSCVLKLPDAEEEEKLRVQRADSCPFPETKAPPPLPLPRVASSKKLSLVVDGTGIASVNVPNHDATAPSRTEKASETHKKKPSNEQASNKREKRDSQKRRKKSSHNSDGDQPNRKRDSRSSGNGEKKSRAAKDILSKYKEHKNAEVDSALVSRTSSGQKLQYIHKRLDGQTSAAPSLYPHHNTLADKEITLEKLFPSRQRQNLNGKARRVAAAKLLGSSKAVVTPIVVVNFSLSTLRQEASRVDLLRRTYADQLELQKTVHAAAERSWRDKEQDMVTSIQHLETELDEATATVRDLRDELESMRDLQRNRETLEQSLKQIPEKIVDVTYMLTPSTFGDCWQESVLKMFQTLRDECALENDKLLTKVRYLLQDGVGSGRAGPGSQITGGSLAERYEARLNATLEAFRQDQKNQFEIAKRRFGIEKRRCEDEAQEEIIRIKEDARRAIEESGKRHEEALQNKIDDLEAQFEAKVRSLETRQQDKETFFSQKLQSLRKQYRDKENELLSKIDDLKSSAQEELEEQLRVYRDEAAANELRREEELDRTRREHERSQRDLRLFYNRSFLDMCGGLQGLVIENRQSLQDMFFIGRWEVMQNCMRMINRMHRSAEEREQKYYRGSIMDIYTRGMEKQQDQFTRELSHVEQRYQMELSHREASHARHFDEFRTQREEHTRAAAETRAHQNQTFWAQCQQALLSAERYMAQYRTEVDVTYQKRHQSIIASCQEYLERDVSAARKAFETELNIRRGQLHQSVVAYHQLDVRQVHMAWEEATARTHIEKEFLSSIHSMKLIETNECETRRLMEHNLLNSSVIDRFQWGSIQIGEDSEYYSESDDDTSTQESMAAKVRGLEATPMATRHRKKERRSPGGASPGHHDGGYDDGDKNRSPDTKERNSSDSTRKEHRELEDQDNQTSSDEGNQSESWGRPQSSRSSSAHKSEGHRSLSFFSQGSQRLKRSASSSALRMAKHGAYPLAIRKVARVPPNSQQSDDGEQEDVSTSKVLKGKRNNRSRRGRGKTRIIFGRIASNSGELHPNAIADVLRSHSVRENLGVSAATSSTTRRITEVFVPRRDLTALRRKYEERLLNLGREREQLGRDFVAALHAEVQISRGDMARQHELASSRTEIIAEYLREQFLLMTNNSNFVIENRLEQIAKDAQRFLLGRGGLEADEARDEQHGDELFVARNGVSFFNDLSKVHEKLSTSERDYAIDAAKASKALTNALRLFNPDSSTHKNHSRLRSQDEDEFPMKNLISSPRSMFIRNKRAASTSPLRSAMGSNDRSNASRRAITPPSASFGRRSAAGRSVLHGSRDVGNIDEKEVNASDNVLYSHRNANTEEGVAKLLEVIRALKSELRASHAHKRYKRSLTDLLAVLFSGESRSDKIHTAGLEERIIFSEEEKQGNEPKNAEELRWNRARELLAAVDDSLNSGPFRDIEGGESSDEGSNSSISGDLKSSLSSLNHPSRELDGEEEENFEVHTVDDREAKRNLVPVTLTATTQSSTAPFSSVTAAHKVLAALIKTPIGLNRGGEPIERGTPGKQTQKQRVGHKKIRHHQLGLSVRQSTNSAAITIGYYLLMKQRIAAALESFTKSMEAYADESHKKHNALLHSVHQQYVVSSGSLLSKIEGYAANSSKCTVLANHLASRIALASEELKVSELTCASLRSALRAFASYHQRRVRRGSAALNDEEARPGEHGSAPDLNDASGGTTRGDVMVTVPRATIAELSALRERNFIHEWMLTNGAIRKSRNGHAAVMEVIL